MGAIEKNGLRFEPEYSVIKQNGAIHVYREGKFIEEISFSFHGKFPELGKIEQLVEDYCEKHEIKKEP
ncbi:YbxH family protein [Cytobacillus sp. Hz8]|uniref:YbxH family protein n=1 Tax=Cytobacillus sp. Hz8 TaxID=3347168 RepID=UPI0035E086CB